ncbi:fibronectin-binding protein [Peptostreptococcus russellii]|uniref:Rqc2 homolog RqcH n=1 Tax=Peptostreptococcus russellii TaxID=215200 RepID=A0A2P7Q085_9FIRM|nr:fibronectin-binding protein [Peptostreptococcus russellii]
MAFDGIVVNSLARELNEILNGSKIDKVYQPERDEICLKVRSREGNKKLVISASASNPRVYLADKYEKNNPKKAPVFCMTLRKHIQNGVIVGIEQVGFERIIKISVESYDELKEKTIKNLYVEIMGKHSNIILVMENQNKILDSIKRVPISISRVRQILPGNEYELPPEQDKMNPLNKINADELLERIKSGKGQVFKSIYTNILGISPLVAKDVCLRVGIDKSKDIEQISLEDSKKIADEINRIFDDLAKDKIYPNVVIDEKRDKIIEFSSIRLKQYEDLTEVRKDTISQAIEDYYLIKDKKERINQKSSNMKKNISLKLERINHKLEKQAKELKDSEKADEYKVKGELLTAFIYMIKPGMESIKLANFYDNNEEIEIKLKAHFSPSENAQKYFKKYNKLKNATEELTKQIAINEEEAQYLENTLLSIENCENEKELKEIKEELMREGYIKTYKMPKKNNKPGTNIMKYISSNGNLIMVGKNNKQNDYLTLRLADNEDLWFHTKDIPGSHVLLKVGGKKFDEKEILEAATLAAYYSKAKMSENVPVDYTTKRNVRKPSGAKPGLVIYEKNKTVYVTPSDEEKAKIKKFEELGE